MAQPSDPYDISVESLDAAINQARRVFEEWVLRLEDIKTKAERLKRISRVGGPHE